MNWADVIVAGVIQCAITAVGTFVIVYCLQKKFE